MKVFSWNVNGLRACEKKGFRRWLDKSGADIVGVQEVRANVEDLGPSLAAPKGWHTHFVAAQRPGYSGVGLYSRRPPDEIITSLGVTELDAEGRLQIARFGNLIVANGYFPNGNDKNRDNSRIPYKLAFYRKLQEHLEPHRAAGRPVLVMGDFNTAHREIDLARPKANEDTSGFRPEERAELDRWFGAGWIDTFREFEQGPGHYTWWSSRFGVRQKNIGWRIDLVVASHGAKPFLKEAAIHHKVKGSDHCPISVTLDPAIVGTVVVAAPVAQASAPKLTVKTKAAVKPARAAKSTRAKKK